MTDIRPARPADKPHLAAMLDDYLRELGPFGATPGPYPHLDSYWQNQERRPWLIGDPPVGFALINAHSATGAPTDHAMAEFCIRPGARRTGLGARAATALFRHYPGQWEVAVMTGNTPALAFWDCVLSAADVTEHHRDRTDQTVIHRFVSEGAPA